MATYSSSKPRWGGQKENQQQGETPLEKKRKIIGNAAGGVKVRSHRNVLSVVNLRAEGGKASEAGGTPSAAAVIVDGSSTTPEAVEALLNLKMVGKTKFDFKVLCRLSTNV